MSDSVVISVSDSMSEDMSDTSSIPGQVGPSRSGDEIAARVSLLLERRRCIRELRERERMHPHLYGFRNRVRRCPSLFELCRLLVAACLVLLLGSAFGINAVTTSADLATASVFLYIGNFVLSLLLLAMSLFATSVAVLVRLNWACWTFAGMILRAWKFNSLNIFWVYFSAIWATFVIALVVNDPILTRRTTIPVCVLGAGVLIYSMTDPVLEAAWLPVLMAIVQVMSLSSVGILIFNSDKDNNEVTIISDAARPGMMDAAQLHARVQNEFREIVAGEWSPTNEPA
jgi:hypothetical protein